MFAESKHITDVGGTHIPLYSRQTPQVATYHGVAREAILQHQPVLVDMATGNVTLLKNLGSVQMPAPTLGIAAFNAPNGYRVAVILQGFVNVNALDLSAISTLAATTVTADAKAKALNGYGQAGLYFDSEVQNVYVNHTS